MHLSFDYRLLLLMAIAILLVGLGTLVTRWPLGIHKTFSQHAAARRSLTIYYSAIFCAALPLLLVFFIGWFIPVLRLPALFTISIVLSCVLQLLCTFIPETKGWRAHWHRALAGVSAIFLPPCLIVLFNTVAVSVVDRLIICLALLVMTGVILLLVVNRSKVRYALFLQTLYFVAFFVPVVFISYSN